MKKYMNTIVSSGNMNINGTKTENAGLDMMYIFDKIYTKYFSGNNFEEHNDDYVLDELNINIRAIPHNYFRSIALSDFSSDCTN